MTSSAIIEADLTWVDGIFHPGIRVALSPGGIIEAAGRLDEKPTLRLEGRALLPGLVNCHSHAFQRGLRGHGEVFRDGSESFWSWREEMYRLVSSMDGREFYQWSLRAFSEMLAAGITSVGEFHYLHHDRSCRGYDFDEVILEAAAEAGIRIVLLNVYYRTGAIRQPLRGGQQRFDSESPAAYWRQMDRLQTRLKSSSVQSLGAAIHSIRAASVEDIQQICQQAQQQGLKCHMHLEEQRREVEECRLAYGQSPLDLMLELGVIGPDFTAVHCTLSEEPSLRRLLTAGAQVCVCPLTEANLGDGVPGLSEVVTEPHQLCLGTDSNARICMNEEMRWLEYGQRLQQQKRGILTDREGHAGRQLFRTATENGARSLGLCCGAIETGRLADFFTLDLDAPSLAPWTPETLLDSFVFGAGLEAIDSTCVGGRWVYRKESGLRRES